MTNSCSSRECTETATHTATTKGGRDLRVCRADAERVESYGPEVATVTYDNLWSDARS